METLDCWEIGYLLGEFLISLPNSQLPYRPNNSPGTIILGSSAELFLGLCKLQESS